MSREEARELVMLSKKVRFYRMLSIFFACCVILIGVPGLAIWTREHALDLGIVDVYEEPPHYKEIKRIMEPIRYSGLKDLLDENTRISVDFKNKEWGLHNIHNFSKEGKIVLRGGRYGLCGDLSAYMFERVSDLLAGEKYSITFVRVAESSFFLYPHSSHIVIKIASTSFSIIPRIYILDPSFHKYRRIEYFDDYMFLEEMSNLEFYENKNTNETFNIGIESPILIKNDFIISMGPHYVDGKFDENNFAVILSLAKRHRYFARPMFSIRKNNGVTETLLNESLALKVLKKEEFKKIRERLEYFFNSIEK